MVTLLAKEKKFLSPEISELKLDKDMLSNEREYFFTFLGERFEEATLLWKEALENHFQKKFTPIFIIPGKNNQYFRKTNFIIINKRLSRIKKDTGKKNFIFLSEQDDINEEFCNSYFIRNLIERLIKKQGRIFILPFTTTNLLLRSSKVIILGPDPDVATKYDSKIEHKLLFDKLKLSRNEIRIFENLEAVRREMRRFPIFLSAAFSSGGHESRIIKNPAQITSFLRELRSINRTNKFIAARFIEDVVLSPNSNAIVVGRNKTIVNCISDQILRDHQYLGNIYPSKATKKCKNKIKMITEKVGNYLSRRGFRGIFGLDFIIDKRGAVFVTDLNPRRQGGYLCHIFAALQKGIDLVDLELRIYLNERVPHLTQEDFDLNYVWAHSKIKPYRGGQKIMRNFSVSSPFAPFAKKGKVHKSIFYPKHYIFVGGTAGYYITTGTSYDRVLRKTRKDVDTIIDQSFSDTPWEDYFESSRAYDLLQ